MATVGVKFKKFTPAQRVFVVETMKRFLQESPLTAMEAAQIFINHNYPGYADRNAKAIYTCYWRYHIVPEKARLEARVSFEAMSGTNYMYKGEEVKQPMCFNDKEPEIIDMPYEDGPYPRDPAAKEFFEKEYAAQALDESNLTMEKVIEFLQQQDDLAAMLNNANDYIDELHENAKKLHAELAEAKLKITDMKVDIRRLGEENDELKAAEEATNMIFNRARKMAMEEQEKDAGPKFRMTKDGNLERVDK